MDKKLILAVAGSGKTSLLISELSLEKRFLIVTYTLTNKDNIQKKIFEKFGFFPSNITLLSFFSFLYNFCYKPFLSYKYPSRGLNYLPNPNRFAKMDEKKYYFDNKNQIFSNRISKFIQNTNTSADVIARLEKYYDYFFIDEIQDLAGNDINFFWELAGSKIGILAVGDFYQHTYDTSRDGTVNKNLHEDLNVYKSSFEKKGFKSDAEKLSFSYRCGKEICDFIKDNLGIEIKSANQNHSSIVFVKDKDEVKKIMEDYSIVKLFYREHYKYRCFSKNWGESKGEDDYTNVSIIVNKDQFAKLQIKEIMDLAPQTRNKLYVAISRARQNVYFISSDLISEYKIN